MGDFTFVPDPATIGGNHGNRFTITLRSLATSNPGETIEELRERLSRIVKSLQDRGYVNYYGLQRFGNGGSNVNIGVAMLNGDWKEAVMGILESNHSNGNVMKKALAAWEETQDGFEAAKVLPKYMHSEIQLFRALGKEWGKRIQCTTIKIRLVIECSGFTSLQPSNPVCSCCSVSPL